MIPAIAVLALISRPVDNDITNSGDVAPAPEREDDPTSDDAVGGSRRRLSSDLGPIYGALSQVRDPPCLYLINFYHIGKVRGFSVCVTEI
jgi:hypothetical protein